MYRSALLPARIATARPRSFGPRRLWNGMSMSMSMSGPAFLQGRWWCATKRSGDQIYPLTVRRGYTGGPFGGNNRFDRSPLRWVKPAVYTVGGVVLVVAAWPVLRFVVIGGLAYGAYRAVNLFFAVRDLDRSMRGHAPNFPGAAQQGPISSLFRSIFSSFSGNAAGGFGRQFYSLHQVAQASLQAACGAELDNRAKDLIYKALESTALLQLEPSQVLLGEPMDQQSSTEIVNGLRNDSISALFPVSVNGMPTSLFVQASASIAGAPSEQTQPPAQGVDICVDALHILARLPSGDVLESRVDIVDQRPPNESSARNEGARKRHVEDADYKEL
ncbi:hypothetical protein GGI07_004231 [Coemansia sp. Benny D115]|nr:hypothetical protein GGI07_004231 [Coemansia sp. Benny D115]